MTKRDISFVDPFMHSFVHSFFLFACQYPSHSGRLAANQAGGRREAVEGAGAGHGVVHDPYAHRVGGAAPGGARLLAE